MPPSRSLRFVPVALLLSLLASLSATVQDQETVQVKDLCFPKQAAASEIEVLVAEGKTTTIKLQSHEFTLPVKLPRQSAWQFGKSGTDAEGKFTFTTQARAKPLPASKQLLVFIRKGPNNADGFRIIPLDAKDIKARDYLVMNLSSKEIAAVVGGQKFKLPPGRHATVHPKADRGEDLCFASLAYQRDDKWRPFFSSNWRLRDNCRTLIFLYNPRAKGSPRIHSVVDPL